MSELPLAQKVVRLEQVLKRRRIPHAFGGALALAYYGEPRATIDIDLNVFVGTDQYERIMGMLEPIGIGRSTNPDAVAKDGQVRLWWENTPVDLFFSYDPLHEAMREGVRSVLFSKSTIPVLGPEHLLVTKAAFNRAKDWIDIEQMIVGVPSLDRDEIHRWLERLLGPDDERLLHLKALESQLIGDE